MKYKEAIKKSMEMLAKDKNAVFIGYNVNYGSRMYGTLVDIPKSKCLETPVAENLMAGLSMGMAIEGYKPVLIFERHDFMLNSLDAIVNHLDKIEKMSNGQFKIPVIIRAIVGAKKPLHPGPQHIQDFTKFFKEFLSFPVYELKTSQEIMKYYQKARFSKQPVMLIEKKDLYDKE
ncbi:MAG: hypothetical protein AABY84_00120 [Candidatus Firestonebacteria bacterium]